MPNLALRWLTLALIVSVIQAPPIVAAQAPSLSQLLARAGEHVRRFEQAFALVLSDEDYDQHASGRGYIGPPHRRMRSEMLFMWLPDEAVWLTVRNVATVDGRDVVGSQERLDDAMRATAAERPLRLRALVNESARFNIGRLFRNFNYPTLVLSYLDPVMQPRFTFSGARRERVNGIETWQVNYAERTTPTVIQGDGANRMSRGAVWIADRDGALVRTRLELTIPRAESTGWATVEVDYQHNTKLGMWVPVKMRETYMEMRGATLDERISGEATYSNFRQFQSSGRLLTPH